nr:polysaccharide deacetylase family protein [Pedobacter glucosidilyticus]
MVKGKYELFRVAAKMCSMLPFKKIISTGDRNLILPLYHTVSDNSILHVKHIYPYKKISEFKKDIDFLLKHYAPISCLELKEFLNKGQSVSRPCFMLSFDDGMKEFYDIIAPILIEKGVPAICFLNTAFLNNKELFYRHKASLLVEHILSNKKKIEQNINLKKYKNYSTLNNYILSIKYNNRFELDILAKELEYDYEDYLKVNQPYLNNQQINSLQKQGFHFGAHSIDHPNFNVISEEEQFLQIKNSVNQVTKAFDIDYKFFSFPFTDKGLKNNLFYKINNDNIIDMSFGTSGFSKETFKTHKHRISFEYEGISAKEVISLHVVLDLVRSFAGKNRIKRL